MGKVNLIVIKMDLKMIKANIIVIKIVKANFFLLK